MKKIFLSAVLAAGTCVLFAQDTTTNRTGDSTYGTMNNGAMNNTTTNNGTMNDSSRYNQMNTGYNQGTGLYNDSSRNYSASANQMYNNSSTSNYSAYGIPNYVQTNVQTQYPSATNFTWDRPTADWYHGYYSDANGRYTHVYYSTDAYYNSQYNPERITGYTLALPVLETYVPDAVISTAANQYKQNLYDITALKGNNNQDVYQVRITDNSGNLRTVWMDGNGTAMTDYFRTDDQMNNMNNTSNNAAMDNDSNPNGSNNNSNPNNSYNTNNNMNSNMNNNNSYDKNNGNSNINNTEMNDTNKSNLNNTGTKHKNTSGKSTTGGSRY